MTEQDFMSRLLDILSQITYSCWPTGPNVNSTCHRCSIVTASLKYLRDEYSISNVAMVGFCWGGGAVHYMMANREDISAGVSCYGIMDQDDPAYGKLNSPTLFIFGGADFIIPTKDVSMKICNSPV